MSMVIINSKDQINELPPMTKEVHLSFRPSTADLISIVGKCRMIRVIEISDSTKKHLAAVAQKYLEVMGIELKENLRQGIKAGLKHEVKEI